MSRSVGSAVLITVGIEEYRRVRSKICDLSHSSLRMAVTHCSDDALARRVALELQGARPPIEDRAPQTREARVLSCAHRKHRCLITPRTELPRPRKRKNQLAERCADAHTRERCAALARGHVTRIEPALECLARPLRQRLDVGWQNAGMVDCARTMDPVAYDARMTRLSAVHRSSPIRYAASRRRRSCIG